MTPPPMWDAVLQQAPVHVWVFDTDLICRYAAPAAGNFLGRPPGAMLGRSAADLLPPAAGEVHHALERATAGERWQHNAYRVHCDGEECHWQVAVRPLALSGARAISLCIAETAAKAELETLRTEVATLRRADAQRRRELRELQAALRAGLAPISGYLQVIAHRPHALPGLSTAEAITGRILPALARLTRTVDRLGEPGGGHAHPGHGGPRPGAGQRTRERSPGAGSRCHPGHLAC